MADPPPIKQTIGIDYDGSGVEEAVKGLDRVESSTDQAGQAAEQSGKATETYAEESRRLRSELLELATAEDRHRAAVERGESETDDAKKASDERRSSIEKLKRQVADAEQAEERLNRELREGVNAHRDAGEATDEGAASVTGFQVVAGKATAALGGFVAGFIGQQGLNLALEYAEERMNEVNERLRENAQLTREAAESRLNFVALQGVEKPEDVAFIDQLSGFAGRDQGEVARSLATFKSQFPNASEADIRSLGVELASLGQTTDAGLDQLAPGLAAVYRKTGNARVAGNLLQQGQTEAGEVKPEKFADAVANFLSISETIGGLDTGQGVGFASAATGLGVGTDRSITGLTNVLFALLGEGTPAGKEIRQREGISSDDLIKALQQISKAVDEGRITGPELEQLGGREAAPVFGALADPDQFANFLASANRVDEVEEFGGRLSQGKAESIVGSSRIQEYNLLLKQIEAQAEAARSQDAEAIKVEVVRAELARVLEERVRDEQIAPFETERILSAFDIYTGRGLSIEDALYRAERVTSGVRVPVLGEAFPNLGPLIGGDETELFRGRGLTDPVLNRVEAGPETDPESIGGDPTPPSIVTNYYGPVYQGKNPISDTSATLGVDP